MFLLVFLLLAASTSIYMRTKRKDDILYLFYALAQYKYIKLHALEDFYFIFYIVHIFLSRLPYVFSFILLCFRN